MATTPKPRKGGTVHDKVHADMYFKEIAHKEHNIILNAIKKQGERSTNGIMRAMTSDNLMRPQRAPRSEEFNTSLALSKNLRTSLVSDTDGTTMLTRGTLPTSIPAKYHCFPDETDWNVAEKRYAELQRELKEVDNQLAEKFQCVERDRQLAGGAITVEDLKPKRGSELVGSAFKWRSEGTSSRSTYQWPSSAAILNKMDEKAVSAANLKAAQYGLYTKSCDFPE